METMYPGIANSPQTELTAAIDEEQTTIPLLNVSVLPPAPNIAVIGSGEDAETVIYEEISGNELINVTRGVEGTAQSWQAGVKVARNFTNYDYEKLRQNNIELEQELATHLAEDVTQGNNPHGIIYEEGTWTPVASGTTTAGNHTYAYQEGRYVRNGNKITIFCRIEISSVDTMSGGFRIGGLPFVPKYNTRDSVGSTTKVKFPTGALAFSCLVRTDGRISFDFTRSEDILLALSINDVVDGWGVEFQVDYQIN